MKTRSSLIGIFFYLFLLAVLTLYIGTPVFAASSTTTLTTTVPSHFNMNVTIIGNGTVEINGSQLMQTGVIPTERNKEILVTIKPAQDYHLSSVIYAGANISSNVNDGLFTLPPLTDDASISITFEANTSMPNTGDPGSYALIISSITAIASLMGIIILLTFNRKKPNT